jgi:hypothetical protein
VNTVADMVVGMPLNTVADMKKKPKRMVVADMVVGEELKGKSLQL